MFLLADHSRVRNDETPVGEFYYYWLLALLVLVVPGGLMAITPQATQAGDRRTDEQPRRK